MFARTARQIYMPMRVNRRLLSGYSDKEKAIIDRMLRVDHAGEYGANTIYQGQLAVLGNTSVGPLIQHMWDQEKVHLDTFNKLIPQYRVRPTAMLPIWNVAGWALGAGTALLGMYINILLYRPTLVCNRIEDSSNVANRSIKSCSGSVSLLSEAFY